MESDANIDDNKVVVLPQWLDNLIFKELGAKYCRSNSDMTVIDWDKSQVLNYLGTYFPRSYAESICIFNAFFKQNYNSFSNKEEISIFDFGCGTGGEIIGLLNTILEFFPKLKKINITALDGNQKALLMYDKVISKYQSKVCNLHLNIQNKLSAIKIDDIYDLDVLNTILNHKFDIIISFKAICEFVTKEQFDKSNPYEHIVSTFLPKLNNAGIMLLVDVSSYNNISKEWLPKMMDEGLNSIKCNIIAKNKNWNQNFYVSHSKAKCDISKACWRLIIN